MRTLGIRPDEVAGGDTGRDGNTGAGMPFSDHDMETAVVVFRSVRSNAA